MASISFLIISPSAILSVIGLLYGRDKTIPTPADDWKKATIDMVIPVRNEEKNIIFCLDSISKQSLQPNNILLVDDHSDDRTVELARKFCAKKGMKLEIITKESSSGKTASLKLASTRSNADVLFVLDGDTVLLSCNYIEQLVCELYQGIGIACACGVILPLTSKEKDIIYSSKMVNDFYQNQRIIPTYKKTSLLNKIQQNITNHYREELYIFLQRFIYKASMTFFGSIINPVGCAVAYRKKYLDNVFMKFHELLGDNLTTSEDVFIGFSFADMGYRNIQIQTVYGLTQEPIIAKIYPQVFKWSSAYLQCCYYFNDLVVTPFKLPRLLYRNIKEKINHTAEKIKNLRKINEAYRQPFGTQYTEKYGRPIGWYVFFAAIEKVFFPAAIVFMAYYGYWEEIFITFGIEMVLFSTVVTMFTRNRKIINFIKSISLAPIRYSVLLFDIYVISFFVKDLIFEKNRCWKK